MQRLQLVISITVLILRHTMLIASTLLLLYAILEQLHGGGYSTRLACVDRYTAWLAGYLQVPSGTASRDRQLLCKAPDRLDLLECSR
jgi:hypothetical protein